MSTVKQILAIVPIYPSAMDTRTIAKRVGLTSRDTSARLRQMANRGQVLQVSTATVGRIGVPATWAKTEEVNP